MGILRRRGDSSCREVASCGSGTWGDIVTDSNTHYVNSSYSGPSDGSINQPHKSVMAAVNAAPSGAIVAIAAGTYTEYVTVFNKSLRLRGRCPSMVEIVATNSAQMAIVLSDAGGSELSGLQIRGPAIGVVIDDSTKVLLDQLWIHHNTGTGLHVQSTAGPASVTLRGSLLESNLARGITVSGSTVAVEQSLIRDTTEESGFGVGIDAIKENNNISDIQISGSVFERNVESDVVIRGSKLSLVGSLIRDSQDKSNQIATGSINLQSLNSSQSEATIQQLVVERAVGTAVSVHDSTATIDNTTVVDTKLDSKPGPAAGILFDDSTGTVKHCWISKTPGGGLVTVGSKVDIEAVVVSQTSTDPEGYGAGIAIQSLVDGTASSEATVKSSLVSDSQATGIYVYGSTADIETTLVSSTVQATVGELGHGLHVQGSVNGATRSAVTMKRGVIEDSAATGVYALGATVDLLGVFVNNGGLDGTTIANGIGMTFDSPLVAQLTIGNVESCHVRGTRDAGILVRSAEVDILTSIVSDTGPQPSGELGIGIDIQTVAAGAQAGVALTASVIERAHGAAVSAAGAKLVMDSCAISDTRADNKRRGVGIASSYRELAPDIVVRGTTIDKSVGSALLLYDASATIEGCAVEGTTSAAGNLFGDALIVVGSEAQPVTTVRGTVLSQSERAAVIASDAQVRYEALALSCQLHDMVGIGTYSFTDEGGARCGCPDALGACSSVNDVLLDIPEHVAGVGKDF